MTNQIEDKPSKVILDMLQKAVEEDRLGIVETESGQKVIQLVWGDGDVSKEIDEYIASLKV